MLELSVVFISQFGDDSNEMMSSAWQIKNEKPQRI